eukprot:g1123.t1
MCAKPRSFSAADIRGFICSVREEDDELLRRVVRCANRNAKAALHFAAQFFPDEQVVELLIECGAEVNACTRRGHTPLIFACGRARDAHVRLLLANGARTAVMTVNGDTAARQGQGRLSEDTMRLLRLAEASEDPSALRDFRQDPEAIAAQIEHAAHCTHCLAKGDWNAHIMQKRQNFPAQAEVALLENSVKAAISDPATLRGVLLDYAIQMAAEPRQLAQRSLALDICLHRVLGIPTALLSALAALCSDAALGQLLARKAADRPNDRRPIRYLLEALMKALQPEPTKDVQLVLSATRHQPRDEGEGEDDDDDGEEDDDAPEESSGAPSPPSSPLSAPSEAPRPIVALDRASVTDIVACGGEPSTLLEVLLHKRTFRRDDCAACESLWLQVRDDEAEASRSSDGYSSRASREMGYIALRKQQWKRQAGPQVTRWLRLMHAVSTLQQRLEETVEAEEAEEAEETVEAEEAEEAEEGAEAAGSSSGGQGGRQGSDLEQAEGEAKGAKAKVEEKEEEPKHTPNSSSCARAAADQLIGSIVTLAQQWAKVEQLEEAVSRNRTMITARARTELRRRCIYMGIGVGQQGSSSSSVARLGHGHGHADANADANAGTAMGMGVHLPGDGTRIGMSSSGGSTSTSTVRYPTLKLQTASAATAPPTAAAGISAADAAATMAEGEVRKLWVDDVPGLLRVIRTLEARRDRYHCEDELEISQPQRQEQLPQNQEEEEAEQEEQEEQGQHEEHEEQQEQQEQQRCTAPTMTTRKVTIVGVDTEWLDSNAIATLQLSIGAIESVGSDESVGSVGTGSQAGTWVIDCCCSGKKATAPPAPGTEGETESEMETETEAEAEAETETEMEREHGESEERAESEENRSRDQRGYSELLRELIELVFVDEAFTAVGFSFKGDIAKLAALSPAVAGATITSTCQQTEADRTDWTGSHMRTSASTSTSTSGTNRQRCAQVVDLQKTAMLWMHQHERETGQKLLPHGHLPSLNRVLDMHTLVSLCKRRGFIFPSSEIYSSFAGFFDYGPLGTELRNNIKQAWWQDMVHRRDDVVGLDCSIISSPAVWVASGHVGGFSDPMVDCKESKLRYRADHLHYAPVVIEGEDEAVGYVCVVEGEESEEQLAKMAKKQAKKVLKANDKKGAKLRPLELRPFTEASEDEIPRIPSPATGEPGSLTPPREFDLMFSTEVGAMEGGTSTAYLRPETAQGTFVNFRNVMTSSRLKLPFGIAQIGKAFRNEITPRNYIFRSREFEQMEIEYFIPPPLQRAQAEAEAKADAGAGAGADGKGAAAGAAEEEGADGAAEQQAQDPDCPSLQPALEVHAQWLQARLEWLKSIGIRGDMLSLDVHPRDKLAHYASACTDIMFKFPFGVQELEGVALRGDYDLRQHQQASGKSLLVEHEYELPAAAADAGAGEGAGGGETQAKAETLTMPVLPYVIEPSLGVDRCMLALLVSSYRVDEVGNDKRTYFSLPPRLAPIKVGVLPLVKNKPKIVAYAAEVRSTLQQRLRHCGTIGWDVTGAIGRRYRRFDEIGTPFCVTIDFESIEGGDGAVTLRRRDCTTQSRLSIDELVALLEEELLA